MFYTQPKILHLLSELILPVLALSLCLQYEAIAITFASQSLCT